MLHKLMLGDLGKNRLRVSASETEGCLPENYLTFHCWPLLASRKAAEQTQDTQQDLMLEFSGQAVW